MPNLLYYYLLNIVKIILSAGVRNKERKKIAYKNK
jgi:hypothetical protein